VKPSILLIDDDFVVLHVLSWQLEAADFSVTAVSSGSDAISALLGAKFDLVITDLVMEGIDGFEVLMTAKKMAPLTPVVIMSGHGEASIDAFRLGADDFLLKPFDIEELSFTIQYLLNRDRQHFQMRSSNLKVSRSPGRISDPSRSKSIES